MRKEKIVAISLTDEMISEFKSLIKNIEQCEVSDIPNIIEVSFSDNSELERLSDRTQKFIDDIRYKNDKRQINEVLKRRTTRKEKKDKP